MKRKGNKTLYIMMLAGAILFAVISFVIIRSTQTVTAIVPNQEISAGTKVDTSMLKAIQVPANTPKGYIIDTNSIVGQKMKTKVSENQLLYKNNVMASWEDFSDGNTIPKDYVVTSLQIPSNRAVGGLVTAGDTVDLIGTPNQNYSTTSKETMENYLGGIAKNSYGANGIQAYWILANVKILETDSTLSKSQDSSISTVTNDKNTGQAQSNEGAFYIVALSYDDYKKLILAEKYLDLHMNISPKQNDGHSPLLDWMNDKTIQELKDAQHQSKIKEEKKNN